MKSSGHLIKLLSLLNSAVSFYNFRRLRSLSLTRIKDDHYDRDHLQARKRSPFKFAFAL